MKNISLIIYFVIITVSLGQNKYFVSENGNDSDNGLTEETAWKTISKVNRSMSIFEAGDQILFQSGNNFTDMELVITCSGKENNYITFSSFGNDSRPIIGSKLSNSVETISIKGTFVKISDLMIYGTNSGIKKNCNAIGLYIDNFIIENCYFEGGKPNDLNLTNTIHINQGIAIATRAPIKNGRIQNNTFAYWYKGIAVGRIRNLLVDNNKFFQIHKGNAGHQNADGGDGGVAIHFFGMNEDNTSWDMQYSVIVSNNEFSEFERWGIAMSSVSNCIVEFNRFHDNLDERIYSGGVRHGNAVKLHDRKSGNVYGDGSIGNIFRYNIIYNLGRHQSSPTYNSDFGANYTIRWYGTVVGGSGLDFQVHNNLVYNCGGGLAETADSHIPGETVSRSDYFGEIYNNTCYNISNDKLSKGVIYMEADNGSNYPPKVKFKNNIIYDGFVDKDHPVIHSKQNLFEGSNIILNNVSYLHNKDTEPSSSHYIWQKYNEYKQEGEQSIITEINQFVDINNYNFNLVQNSPAINKAAPLGNDKSGVGFLSKDILQNLRTIPDIGAFEYVGNSDVNSNTQLTPIINSQTTNKTVSLGEDVGFSITAECKDSIGYQWWKLPNSSNNISKIVDGMKYIGATSNTLKIKDVTIEDANAKYICEVYNTKDHSNLWINSEPVSIMLTQSQGSSESENLLVFLEAPYNNGHMNTLLNSTKFIPKTQPYKNTPWYLESNAEINEIKSNYVDWVIVELRKAEKQITYRKVGVLSDNGVIVNADGSKLSFNNINSGEYYLVIKHRNHLGIMSAFKISVKNNEPVLYDFSQTQNSAFGNRPMTDLGDGKFGLYAGDADANGIINNLDFGKVANSIPYKGYSNNDLDMNGTVNVLDYNKINKNILKGSQIPK